jgi:ATP-dependent Clp protease ATP-binding subunit ClpA
MEPKRITLSLTEESKEWLANAGYDVAYGARPLNRVISKQILNPMARLLLHGDIKEGDSVKIDVAPTASPSGGRDDEHDEVSPDNLALTFSRQTGDGYSPIRFSRK